MGFILPLCSCLKNRDLLGDQTPAVPSNYRRRISYSYAEAKATANPKEQVPERRRCPCFESPIPPSRSLSLQQLEDRN
jgi:hypothetical protein